MKHLGQQLPDGRVTHRFEWVVLLLTLLIIPVVLFEEADHSPLAKTIAAILNWLIWAGFLLEFALILAIAERRRAALRAHWLELLVIACTSPSLPQAFDLVRFFRLARIGVVATRVLRTGHRLADRRSFPYVALTAIALVTCAGALMTVIDPADFPSIHTGIWWAIVTITTVGYGDVVPHSAAGQFVAVGVMIAGITFIAFLTAVISSTLVAREEEEQFQITRDDIDKLVCLVERLDARMAALEAHVLGNPSGNEQEDG